MNRIVQKSAKEIALMAEGGQKLSEVLIEVLKKIRPGLSTLKVDSWVEEGISKAGGEPSFKKVRNYRYASCVGLNDEVVHSLPRIDKIIKEGDLVKVDLGLLWKGFHTDLSWTIEAYSDTPSVKNQDFLKAGREALKKAISVSKNGNRVGHISGAIQETVEKAGYNPVRVLTGHGIGKKLHEDPTVPCFLGEKIKGTPKLAVGMTLAIEVIYVESSPEVVLKEDGWTISTKDGKMSALFEETIAITKDGPLILTPMDFSGDLFKINKGIFLC